MNPPGRRVIIGLRLATLVAFAALCWLFARTIDPGKLAHALAGAHPWPLAVALTLPFAVLGFKATCWQLLLAPRHQVSIARLVRYTVVAVAASAVAPARAGEAVRVWMLRQRDGIPIADGAAIAVAEKLLDGTALFILVAPLPWLLPELPTWVTSTVIAGCVVVTLMFAGVSIAVARVTGRDEAPTGAVSRFLAGMHGLRSRRAAAALAVLLAAWLVELTAVELVLAALDIPLPIAAAPLVLLTVNLSIVVPVTPGQVGVHEAGALAALNLLHVSPERALSFALIYHATQIIPLLLAGAMLEGRLLIGSRARLSGSS